MVAVLIILPVLFDFVLDVRGFSLLVIFLGLLAFYQFLGFSYWLSVGGGLCLYFLLLL